MSNPNDIVCGGAAPAVAFRTWPFGWSVSIRIQHIFHGMRLNAISARAVVDDFGDLVVVERFL